MREIGGTQSEACRLEANVLTGQGLGKTGVDEPQTCSTHFTEHLHLKKKKDIQENLSVIKIQSLSWLVHLIYLLLTIVLCVPPRRPSLANVDPEHC